MKWSNVDEVGNEAQRKSGLTAAVVMVHLHHLVQHPKLAGVCHNQHS